MVWCNPAGEHREFTFGDMSRLSNQAANVFRSHGVKKGDKVLVILKRNYEYWYVAPALHKLGAVIIPATHMLTVDDLVYRIQTANISAAIGTPDGTTVADLIEARKSCPQLRTIFAVRNQQPGTVDFTTEMERAPTSLEREETKVTGSHAHLLHLGHHWIPQSGDARSHLYPLSYYYGPVLANSPGEWIAPHCGGDRMGKGILGKDLWAVAVWMCCYGV